MRTTDCEICDNKNVPVNDTIKIEGKIYCPDSVKTHFPDESSFKGLKIEQQIDPTICSSCQKDFGIIELKKISVYPICRDCEEKIKNRTFPKWVQAFFIAVIAIVGFSFLWNWKFYQAYRDIQNSNASFENSDYSNAAILMAQAVEKVPEVHDLKILYAYYHGVDLLYKDKSAEAMEEFNKCKDDLPPDYNIKLLMIRARMGATFDSKNYNGFLEAAKENMEMDSTIATSWAAVASAYSCLFVAEGNNEDKNNTYAFLSKAQSIDSTSDEMKQYYNMIEYRIDSRKIIKREEFAKQFPNGWTKN